MEQVPTAETTVLQRFQGWATGLPLPVGGTITGAGIQTSSEGRESLYYTLTVTYGSGSDPAALADAVRRSLPTPEFAVDPKPATGDALDNWVYLTSPFFADAHGSAPCSRRRAPSWSTSTPGCRSHPGEVFGAGR
ncbi:MAG: hypothetical protein R2761_16885 [Acidimicrobiales bacterium]